MAEATNRERLLPFLLDRLTQENPQGRQESVSSRTWTLRQTHQAVVRDLGWLLNTACRPSFDGLEEFPLVNKSVLNYGMPDLCGRTASGTSAQELEKLITEVIERYEPRIQKRSLKIRVVEHAEGPSGGPGGRPNAVTLEIKADIWAQPMPDSLYLKTEVDLESGQCQLQDKQYG